MEFKPYLLIILNNLNYFYNNNIINMIIFNKIVNSRVVLKELLKGEWDTDTMPILSMVEIEKLYNFKPAKNSVLNLIGNAGRCSISLNNRIVPEHKLHIIYYNFPEIDKNSSKVTKSIITRIENMYEFYNQTDNILIIINEPINETITKLIDIINLNNKKKNSENIDDVSTLLNKYKSKGYNYNSNYLKTVHIISIDSLQKNLLEHGYIPKHIPIRDSEKIITILNDNNATINQVPVISKFDIVSRLILLNSNDLVDIKRNSAKCGEYSYYRVCK